MGTNQNGISSGNIIISKPQMIAGVVTNLFGILANSLLDNFIQNAASELNPRVDQAINEAQLSQKSNLGDNLTRNPETDQQINNLTFGQKNKFEPDAIPNGRGGYEQSSTGYWTKRLSAITGLPVMSAITFVGTTYLSLNGQQVTIPTITFEMVIITMKKGRNIEKTDITGRDTGSVKEWIGMKDWTIEIRAVILASQNVSELMTDYYQEGKYPEENMEMIDLLINAPIAIKVLCPYMNRRGVNYLVIDDDVQISQVEGEYEAQRLVIPCVSDNPLYIQVANKT